MEFDDFSINKRRNEDRYRNDDPRDRFRNSRHSHHSYHQSGNNYKWQYFLEQLKNNRKLKRVIIFALLFIFIIIVTLLVIFLPLILKLFNYISQHGVQGLLEGIIEFLNKIWSGSSR